MEEKIIIGWVYSQERIKVSQFDDMQAWGPTEFIGNVEFYGLLSSSKGSIIIMINKVCNKY